MLFSRAAFDAALALHPHPPFLQEEVLAAPTAFEVRGDGVGIGNQGKEDRLVSQLFNTAYHIEGRWDRGMQEILGVW